MLFSSYTLLVIFLVFTQSKLTVVTHHAFRTTAPLDQMCLVCALRTVAPTMNIACCYAISLNILVRYGVNADVNGDGEISPDEWAALDVILRAQGAGAAVDPQHTKHARTKHRLISLML